MFKVIWCDDYGCYEIVGSFDDYAKARAFADDYEDECVSDPYADGCIIEDENGDIVYD